MIRNFTGRVAGTLFLLIYLSSRERIRKWSYHVFYAIHVGIAPLAFIFTVLHYSKSWLYMLPGFTLYFISIASTNLRYLLRDRGAGVKVLSCQEIFQGGSFYELTIQQDESEIKSLQQQLSFKGGDIVRDDR